MIDNNKGKIFMTAITVVCVYGIYQLGMNKDTENWMMFLAVIFFIMIMIFGWNGGVKGDRGACYYHCHYDDNIASAECDKKCKTKHN